MKISLKFLTALSLLSIAAWASEGTDGIETRLLADDLAVVYAGEVIYQQHCAACHGASLEGEADWRTRDAQGYLPAPPHDKTGHTWHHSDDLLFEITKYGAAVVIGDDSYQSKMPTYGNILSDDEIVAVLSYIKNTWPEDERSWQDEMNDTQNKGFEWIQKKPSTLDKLLK